MSVPDDYSAFYSDRSAPLKLDCCTRRRPIELNGNRTLFGVTTTEESPTCRVQGSGVTGPQSVGNLNGVAFRSIRFSHGLGQEQICQSTHRDDCEADQCDPAVVERQ